MKLPKIDLPGHLTEESKTVNDVTNILDLLERIDDLNSITSDVTLSMIIVKLQVRKNNVEK